MEEIKLKNYTDEVFHIGEVEFFASANDCGQIISERVRGPACPAGLCGHFNQKGQQIQHINEPFNPLLPYLFCAQCDGPIINIKYYTYL